MLALRWQGRLEKTMLGEISISIREVFAPNGWYIDVHLDSNAIQQLFLGISADRYPTPDC